MVKNYFYILLFFVLILSCSNDDGYTDVSDDDIVQVSPVVFDIEAVPYQTLSEYNFFNGELKDLEPVYGVLPYDMITPLFSEYAKKKRFVWMPENVSASYVSDHDIIDFPLGTILIKNFYYDNILPNNTTKIIETRLQIRKEEGWVFANYVWNEEQTEASFDLSGSYQSINFIANGEPKSVNYQVPAASQCLTCHKTDNAEPMPIGVKPNSLNKAIAYANETKNQLQKWVEIGYLSDNVPESIATVVNWEDESEPLELRARSYLDINCAHCHADNRHCDYRPVRFAYNETEDLVNTGVCVDADDVFDPALTKIIEPGNSERSILSFRIKSVEQSTRMPLLARTIQHKEGIQLIDAWINSLTNCD